MAYLSSEDEEQKKNQDGNATNPGLQPDKNVLAYNAKKSDSSVQAGSDVNPQYLTRQPPTSGQPGQRGTGFVNIQDYLGANKSMGGKIRSEGEKTLSEEQAKFSSDKATHVAPQTQWTSPDYVGNVLQAIVDRQEGKNTAIPQKPSFAGNIQPLGGIYGFLGGPRAQQNTKSVFSGTTKPSPIRPTPGDQGAVRSMTTEPAPQTASTETTTAIKPPPIETVEANKQEPKPVPYGTEDLDAIMSGLLGASYTGPGKWDYAETPEFTKNSALLSQVPVLGGQNAQGGPLPSVEDYLASERIQQGKYTAGERALDRALIGADLGAQSAISQNAEDVANYRGDRDTSVKQFNDAVKAAQDSAKFVQDTAKNKLGSISSDTSNAVSGRVQSAPAQDRAAAEQYAKDYEAWYNSDARKNDRLNNAWNQEFVAGEAAGPSNVITQREADTLAAIQKFLGGNSAITKTGERKVAGAQSRGAKNAQQAEFDKWAQEYLNRPVDYYGGPGAPPVKNKEYENSVKSSRRADDEKKIEAEKQKRIQEFLSQDETPEQLRQRLGIA